MTFAISKVQTHFGFERLKVSYFQNQFMKSTFLQKYKQQIVCVVRAEILTVFWEKRGLHKLILKLTDLYDFLNVCANCQLILHFDSKETTFGFGHFETIFLVSLDANSQLFGPILYRRWRRQGFHQFHFSSFISLNFDSSVSQ